MIKALVFDADGVLINGRRFADVLESDYGIVRDHTVRFFEGAFLDCLVGKADLKKELEPHLSEWRIDKTVDEFVDYWFTSEHTINEPLIDFIQQQRNKGVRCYIATNQEKYRTVYMIEHMGFKDAFDGVYSSADLGYRKPDGNFYLKLVKEISGVKPEEIMFWDDMGENVFAAKNAGMHGEIYTNFEDFKIKISQIIS